MRPVEVSVDEIVEAGNQLVSEGKKVTGFALRQITDRGNPSRLRSVWEEHVKQISPEKTLEKAALPAEIERLLSAYAERIAAEMKNMACELNQRSVQAAEVRVTEILRTAEELKNQTSDEISDAVQSLIELDGRLNASSEEGLKLRTELNSARMREAELRESCAQLKGKCEALEQQLSELHKKLQPVPA